MADEPSPLEKEIRRVISVAGPMPVAEYMRMCIAHPEHEIRDATPLGRWICNYSSNTSAPRAVRRRMHLAAELVDRVCSERRGARILSLALQ